MPDIRTSPRRRWTRPVAGPVAAVALTGLAACGTTAAGEAPEDVDAEAWAAAQAACADLAPTPPDGAAPADGTAPSGAPSRPEPATSTSSS